LENQQDSLCARDKTCFRLSTAANNCHDTSMIRRHQTHRLKNHTLFQQTFMDLRKPVSPPQFSYCVGLVVNDRSICLRVCEEFPDPLQQHVWTLHVAHPVRIRSGDWFRIDARDLSVCETASVILECRYWTLKMCLSFVQKPGTG